MSAEPSPTPTTDVDAIPRIVEGLRRSFASGQTRPLAWRKEQLARLAALTRENADALLGALARDFGKPAIEALLMDVALVTQEADSARRSLDKWTKPEKVGTPLNQRPGSSRLLREPLG